MSVAGAVHPDLEIGDMFIFQKIAVNSTGHGLFSIRSEIPNMDTTFFKADPTLIKLAETAAQELKVNYRIGRHDC